MRDFSANSRGEVKRIAHQGPPGGLGRSLAIEALRLFAVRNTLDCACMSATRFKQAARQDREKTKSQSGT
jgi:hypothetical protein